LGATYQWQECSTSGGTYTTIPGATSSAYTPVAGDAGDYFEVMATGTGNYTGSVTSAPTSTSVSAIPSATINTTTVTFDQNSADANYHTNVVVDLTLNGNTLSSITNGGIALTSPADYTVSGSTVTIPVSYLSSLGLGKTTLTFNFSAGAAATLNVQVENMGATVATCTVSYDGNNNDGGSIPTGSLSYDQGATITVLGNSGGLTRSGYTFVGWNTAANGSGAPYAPGNVFSITGNVTLYAQWMTTTVLLPPTIDPDGGIFTVTNQAVSIIDPNPAPVSVNDAVYYSLHGVNPALDGTQSTLYTGLPFILNQSAEVSAAVYNKVYGWSQPACATFTFIIPPSAYTVASGITAAPDPTPNATSLSMPTVPSGFTIAITASSNTAVIALDGTITPPSTSTIVDLTFTVTRTGRHDGHCRPHCRDGAGGVQQQLRWWWRRFPCGRSYRPDRQRYKQYHQLCRPER
jgi:uncharacterized repeat protein (TIGR02543 family)